MPSPLTSRQLFEKNAQEQATSESHMKEEVKRIGNIRPDLRSAKEQAFLELWADVPPRTCDPPTKAIPFDADPPALHKRTMAQLAQEAIDIQNACNPLGLTKTFAKVTQELYELLGGMTAVRNHPVWHAWLEKLIDMAGYDEDNAGVAHMECIEIAKAERDVRIPGVAPDHLEKLAGSDCVLQLRTTGGWETMSAEPEGLACAMQAAKVVYSCGRTKSNLQFRIADLDADSKVFAYFDVKDGKIVPSTYHHKPGDED